MQFQARLCAGLTAWAWLGWVGSPWLGEELVLEEGTGEFVGVCFGMEGRGEPLLGVGTRAIVSSKGRSIFLYGKQISSGCLGVLGEMGVRCASLPYTSVYWPRSSSLRGWIISLQGVAFPGQTAGRAGGYHVVLPYFNYTAGLVGPGWFVIHSF